MRLFSIPLALALVLAPAPAFAAAVNNYNPTEGFLANGLDAGKHLFDFHLTAQTPTSATSGTLLVPSVGFDMGFGAGWEFGLTTQLNAAGLGTAAPLTSLDQVSGYLHGGLLKFADVWQLGVVAGANVPYHPGASLQLGGEAILELDVGPMAFALNSGYLRDFTANNGQLYENLNAGGQWGAYLPYAEVGVNIYPDGRPTDAVLRGDLGYAVTERFTADANLALFYPTYAWGPSLGLMYTF